MTNSSPPLYTAPTFNAPAFNCPYCSAYAHQLWGAVVLQLAGLGGQAHPRERIAKCSHCHEFTYWVDEKLVWPEKLTAEPAHDDMPVDCKEVFEEARAISSRSARGAAALLRLVVQLLMPHLGEKGENLNADIASLVTKGLPVELQMALDACRVIGNNAVHPGSLDVTDSPEIAAGLFRVVNFIVDDRIRRPVEVKALYDKLPTSALQAIAKRDTQP